RLVVARLVTARQWAGRCLMRPPHSVSPRCCPILATFSICCKRFALQESRCRKPANGDAARTAAIRGNGLVRPPRLAYQSCATKPYLPSLFVLGGSENALDHSE